MCLRCVYVYSGPGITFYNLNLLSCFYQIFTPIYIELIENIYIAYSIDFFPLLLINNFMHSDL